MPGCIKIGKTDNLEKRIRELDNTSVPLPFECFHASAVKDSTFVEKQLHEAFGDHRVRPKREFFQVSPEKVVAALKLAEIENVTPKNDFVESPEDQQALNKARSRRSNFNFKMANIPANAELTFVNDDKIKAKVIDDRSIEFNGEITSLSKAAQKVLSVEWPVAGTIYWMFEGETLDQRRTRFETGE